MSFSFNYSIITAVSSAASVTVVSPFPVTSSTPLVAYAIRLDTGVKSNPLTTVISARTSSTVTVDNPFGSGVNARFYVARKTLPGQDYNPSAIENFQPEMLEAALDKTASATQELYGFVFGNEAEGMTARVIWSDDPFELANAIVRKGKLIRFNATNGAPEYLLSALTVEEQELFDFLDENQDHLVNVNADWNATSGDAAILNKPATFPPSAHEHEIADVTLLQATLNALAAAIAAIQVGYGYLADAIFNSVIANTFVWAKQNFALGANARVDFKAGTRVVPGDRFIVSLNNAGNTESVEHYHMDSQGFSPSPNTVTAEVSALWLGDPEQRWGQAFIERTYCRDFVIFNELGTSGTTTFRLRHDDNQLSFQSFSISGEVETAEDYLTCDRDVPGTVGFWSIFRDLLPVGVVNIGRAAARFTQGWFNNLYANTLGLGSEGRAEFSAANEGITGSNNDDVVILSLPTSASPSALVNFYRWAKGWFGPSDAMASLIDLGRPLVRWRFIYGDRIKTNWVNFFTYLDPEDPVPAEVDLTFSYKFELRGTTLYLERWNGTTVTHEMARFATNAAGGNWITYQPDQLFWYFQQLDINEEACPPDGALIPVLRESTVSAGDVEAEAIQVNQHAYTFLKSATSTTARTAIGAASAADLAALNSATATALSGKQNSNNNLSAIAGQTLAANKLLYATGAGAVAQTDFPAFARTLSASADAAAARGTLQVREDFVFIDGDVVSAPAVYDIGAPLFDGHRVRVICDLSRYPSSNYDDVKILATGSSIFHSDGGGSGGQGWVFPFYSQFSSLLFVGFGGTWYGENNYNKEP